MPEVRRTQEKYEALENFALFTVSNDGNHSMSDLHELIAEHDISYPVMVQLTEEGYASKFGWNVNAVPTTFIVDPQGTILNQVWIDEDLDPVLDFLTGYDGYLPPVGIQARHVKNDDKTYSLTAEIYNPTHEPIKVELIMFKLAYGYWDEEKEEYFWDEEGVRSGEDYAGIGWVSWDVENLENEYPLEFGEFGNAVIEVTVPRLEGNFYGMGYDFNVVLPGSEVVDDGDGIVISAGGEMNFRYEKKEQENEPDGNGAAEGAAGQRRNRFEV